LPLMIMEGSGALPGNPYFVEMKPCCIGLVGLQQGGVSVVMAPVGYGSLLAEMYPGRVCYLNDH